MKLLLLCLLNALTLAVSTIANAQGVRCNHNICEVRAPFYYDNLHSPTFSYKFEWVRVSANAAVPTFIIIPGGPGQTTMGHIKPGQLLPAEFNVIYTDPRGAGYNSGVNPSLPGEFYRGEFVARDILTAIKALRLKNYVIYGASFGTLASTILGSVAETESQYAPKALILEGTIGHSFLGFNNYFRPYSLEWQRVKAALEPTVASSFIGPSMPLGFSNEQWGAFVDPNLLIGDWPGKGHVLRSYLTPSNLTDSPATRTAWANILSHYPVSIEYEPLRRTIVCQEITLGQFRIGQSIQNGELVATGPNICAGISKRLPYDSKKWLVKAPIYYFSGQFDPATPIEQAQYHFINQIRSRRSFVLVKDASHSALTRSLGAIGCAPGIWRAIGLDPANFENALNSCQGYTHLTTLNPN